MVNSTGNHTDVYNDSDRCPVDIIQNVSHQSIEKHTTYSWSSEEQSLLLSMFYYGYVAAQLPTGFLSNYWNPQHVFGFSVLLSGVFCALVPVTASVNVWTLVVCNLFMGLTQAGLYPSNIVWSARWAPSVERTTILLISTSGSTLGNIVAPVITGVLCDSDILGGWPAAFYLFGVLSCLWYVVWLIVARHDVSTHPWISADEKQLIMQSSGVDQHLQCSCPPWSRFLTSRGVYAVMLAMMFYGSAYYIIYTSFPTYMKRVLNYDMQQDSMWTAAPHLASFVIGLAVGPLADAIIRRRWLSVTVTRKLFVFVGGLILSVLSVAVGFVSCDRFLAVILITVACGFAALVSVGTSVSLIDMAPRHVGVLYSITNMVNNVGGFLCPQLIEKLTRGSASRSRWQIVFFIMAGFNVCGTVSLLVLGTSERQSWNATHSGDDDDGSHGDNNDNDDETGQLLGRAGRRDTYGTI